MAPERVIRGGTRIPATVEPVAPERDAHAPIPGHEDPFGPDDSHTEWYLQSPYGSAAFSATRTAATPGFPAGDDAHSGRFRRERPAPP